MTTKAEHKILARQLKAFNESPATRAFEWLNAFVEANPQAFPQPADGKRTNPWLVGMAGFGLTPAAETKTPGAN